MNLNFIVLEYSVSQDCFHIQSVVGTIQDNLMNAFSKCNSDYVPIGFFESELEAHQFAARVREAMEKQTKKDINNLINKALKRQ